MKFDVGWETDESFSLSIDAKHVTVRESSGWEWMSARNVRYRMKSGGVIYGLDCDADDYERGDEVISSKS